MWKQIQKQIKNSFWSKNYLIITFKIMIYLKYIIQILICRYFSSTPRQSFVRKLSEKQYIFCKSMQNQELISSEINDINAALEKGYLSISQVQISMARKNYKMTYDELIQSFHLSGKKALAHYLLRTSMLYFWDYSMPWEGVNYLNEFDKDIFINIIKNAANDQNCIPSLYKVSIVILPEKSRNENILLIINGNPSRYNYKAVLILYLFGIDLLLIPPHISHLLQVFDMASPLKSFFKEFLIHEKYDQYLLNSFIDRKQTAGILISSMIFSF